MYIGILSLIGLGVGALLGTAVKMTDVGQAMEDVLEDAADCIKRIVGR